MYYTYKSKYGFTLIELTIALAVVAILAIISVWMYSSQVKKSRRADAMDTIMSISLAEERYRSTNSQYGTLAQVWGGVSTTSGGYYTITITNNSATAYTITATAQGTQTSDTENATACNSLQLVMSNGTATKTPAACWSD